MVPATGYPEVVRSPAPMKCTVVLPVYNAGAPLREAIESILTQSEPDFEFLIIDDCSMDGSAATIRQYAAKDKRIRSVFHQKNLGVAKTLNEGLLEARAEFVVRMDADDIALPERLARQIAFMRARPEVAVAGSFVYHMGRTVALDRLVPLPVEHDEIVARLQGGNCIYHPSVILRRQQILAVGGYRTDFRHAEDYELWLRTSKSCQLANIPVPLLRYRFSLGGESLAKRLDQALYAKMAQLTYTHPDWSLEQLQRQGAVMMQQEGTAWFLEQVVRGTMRELLSLGLTGDALRIFWHFLPQLGWKRAFAVARDFPGDLLRAGRTRSGSRAS